MVGNFASLVAHQVGYLVSSLSKKNYKANVAEIHSLIEMYGEDINVALLETLLRHIDLTNGAAQKEALKIQLFTKEIQGLIEKDNFATIFCKAFQCVEMQKEGAFSTLIRNGRFPPAVEIALGVAIVSSSSPLERAEGIAMLQTKIPALCKQRSNILTLPVAHSLLTLVKTTDELRPYRAALARVLASQFPATKENVILTPLLTEFADANLRQVPAGEVGASLMMTLTEGVTLGALMADLGPACTATPQAFAGVLEQFPTLTELDVATGLGVLVNPGSACTESMPLVTRSPFDARPAGATDATEWRMEVFVDGVKQAAGSLKWPAIMRALDHRNFYVPDPRGLTVLMAAFKRATKDPFPLDVIFNRWVNTGGQISLIQQAVLAPPDVFSFANSPRRQPMIDSSGGGAGANKKGAARAAPGNDNQAWYSLDLLETLLNLAEGEQYTAVQTIFKAPMQQYPELILLGIAQLKPTWETFTIDLVGHLLPQYLTNHPQSSALLHRLWNMRKDFVCAGMARLHAREPASVSRLLDVAHDLKALAAILEYKPWSFTIDLAALASRREYLNLEKWLQDQIGKFQLPFMRSCMQFLSDKMAQRNDPQRQGAPQLSGEIMVCFFRCLHAASSLLPPAGTEELKMLYSQCMSVYPELSPAQPPVQPETFAQEIEDEANATFQKIFTDQVQIAEVVEMLKRFKNSPSQHEQDVFRCMVHNLYDEYRFFPKYPDKVLITTGKLFGALIQHHLVSHGPLGTGLRFVLEALRKQHSSKMFRFGLWALRQFKSRLHEWPQYCSMILQIPHIVRHHPDVVEYVHKILQDPDLTATPEPGQDPLGYSRPSTEELQPLPEAKDEREDESPEQRPPGRRSLMGGSSAAVEPVAAEPTTPSAAADVPAFNATGNFQQIAEQGVQAPPTVDEAVMDRIHFIFNNLSQTMMDAKVAELKEFFRAEHYDFFAYYIVVKRACGEANFHKLYLTFLDKVAIADLNQAILRVTFENIRVLLRSERIKTNSTDRGLLKNLGSWLGGLTVARNRVLLHRDLAVKELILEAYTQGRLIAVIPFVAKILEACATSKVFKAPNPWTVAMLRLLSELYNIPRLKQYLKFEIEVLCKKLDMDINEIQPTNLLASQRIDPKAANYDFTAREGQRDAGKPDVGPSAAGPSLTGPEPAAPAKPSEPAGFDAGAAAPGGAAPGDALVPAQFITISPSVVLFQQQPHFKRFVPMALERALREIMTPVVERSVTIACLSTRELILKDFAMEPDEQKMRHAAHLMVQSLAGSLALVTCKEPLRVSISNHLRQLLTQHSPDAQLLDLAVAAISTDNLELACQQIEKGATEKAVRDIDDALAPAINVRRKHRERTGQPYYDMSIFTAGRYPSSLPEPLRPKPGGLQPMQQRVYEDFARSRALRSPTPGDEEHPAYREAAKAGGDAAGGELAPSGPVLSPQQALVKAKAVLTDLKRYLAAGAQQYQTVHSTPPNSEIRQLLAQLPQIAMVSQARNETALALAQKAFSKLFENEPPLHQDAYFVLLQQLQEVCRKVAKEVTSWLMYAEDERRFHPVVTVRLLRGGLLLLPELDQHLVKMMDSGRNQNAVEFAAMLLRKCVIDEPLISASDLFMTTELITRLARQRGKGRADRLVRLVEELSTVPPRKDVKIVRTPLLPGGAAAPAPGSAVAPVRPVGVPAVAAPGGTGAAAAAAAPAVPKTPRRSLAIRGGGEPQGLRERVQFLFDEWLQVCAQQGQTEKVYASFLARLQQQGMLKGDEVTTHFFRICTEISVDSTLAGDASASFAAVDAFSKLVFLLVKYSSDPFNSPMNKIGFLNKVVAIVIRVLLREHDNYPEQFNQRPYFRLFVNLMMDLNAPNAQLEPISFQVLSTFCHTFHEIRPVRVPSMAFAWLELISHRTLMPKLLMAKSQKGWGLFQRLLVDLFHFLEPFLRNADLSAEHTHMLYKGTLRVLLVLLHDFPEFLCDYHFSFCDAIPPSCIQMRNLILSAFPRNMRLPDPFTPNLKVDLLPEINQSPRLLSLYADALQTRVLPGGESVRVNLDTYLTSRSPASFPMVLRGALLAQPGEASQGTQYNVPLINSVVLYVGVHAVAQSQAQKMATPMAHSAPMDVFQELVMELETEGRYLVLNAIANQLRYPNNHTHYFSCVLLYLFAEANQEIIQEQITRVLLERLIVNRPHPWGLLITFIELIKNPTYNFWRHAFTRCAPEIERLFESVARSCMGNQLSTGGKPEELPAAPPS